MGAKKEGNATKKAVVMANVAFGESNTLSHTVQGWRQSSGALWKVNSFVKVIDPLLEVTSAAEWLIGNITYTPEVPAFYEL